MKKIKYALVLVIVSMLVNIVETKSQTTSKEQAMLEAIETLDYDIVRYFPRWKVCEPNLQIHIYQVFLKAGFDKELLNMSNIEILAAPGDFDTENGNYQILLASCGDAAMSPYQINTLMTPHLRKSLSGENSYSGTGSGRTYCYKDIPPEIPVSTYQAEAIINYMQPNDVSHAISLSLFEQNLKIGESGFWLKSVFGNDKSGYQFWSSGEASIVMQRPLYVNRNINTSRAIPYLLDLSLGIGYRIMNGIEKNPIFSWIPNRILNGPQGGTFIFGVDFYLPPLPQLGVSFDASFPFEKTKTAVIEPYKWGKMENIDLYGNEIVTTNDGREITHIVPVMQSSGHFSIFYNWWLNRRRPENYIRADLGLCYTETREMGMYKENDEFKIAADTGIEGLRIYKPSSFMDWLYIKLEYRNQATWPFGLSAQISNRAFLGNVWFPIFGNWLLLEIKYSTILNNARPYEVKSFLMFSPVIRITI
jgi:hypothetical protein